MLDGTPLINRLADILQPIATRLTVVADKRNKYSDLGLPTIADRQPNLGPLGGLDAALADMNAHQATNQHWILVVSCDLVIFRHSWFVQLWTQCESHQSSNAIAFKNSENCWEPLLALYNRTIHSRVQEHIAEDRRSMQYLLNNTETTPVPTPQDWPDLIQVNTEDELQQFIRSNPFTTPATTTQESKPSKPDTH